MPDTAARNHRIEARTQSAHQPFAARGPKPEAPRRRRTAAWWFIVPMVAAGMLPGRAAAQGCPPNGTFVISGPASLNQSWIGPDNCQITASGVLTIDPPFTLTMSGGTLLTNLGNLLNSGTLIGGITNAGVLNNMGTGILKSQDGLQNKQAGVLNNAGIFQNSFLSNDGVLNNAGTVTNLGTLSNSSTGKLYNNPLGSISNSGTLSNSGLLESYGTLTNNIGKQLDNNAAATLNIKDGGMLNNNGSLTNWASTAGIASVLNIETLGTLNNTGNLDVIGAGRSGASATLNNYGTLTNTGTLKTTGIDPHVSPDFGGTVNSYGELVNNGTVVNGGTLRAATRLDNVNPTLYGTITNNALLTNNLWMGVDGGSTLTNRGTLVNNFQLAIGGFLSNFGILNNVTQLLNFGTLTNEGGTSGGGGGTIDNRYQVVNLGGWSNNGGSGPGSRGAVLNNYGSFQIGSMVNGAGTGGGGAAVLNNFGTLDMSESFSELRSDGTIVNSGSFIIGPGAQVSGTGRYTQIAGGTTTVNGKLSGGFIDVQTGVLTGGGLVDPPSQILIGKDAFVQPGFPIGTLTFLGNAQFDGELDIEIAGLTSHDLLKVIGAIDFGAGSKIKFLFEGYDPQQGDNFSFLDASALNGFANVSFLVSGLGAGFGFDLRDAGNGNLELHTTMAPGVVAVPEPETWLLLALGVSGIGMRRRALQLRRCE